MNVPVDRLHMCPCGVRLWKKGLVGFLSLNHPDEVHCSRNVLIESCPVGNLSSCRTEEWDNWGGISYLYINDNGECSHCPDLACATHCLYCLGFNQGHDSCLEKRD